MNRHLAGELNDQLRDASRRSTLIYEIGPSRHKWRPAEPGPSFLDAPGQAIGTIGAIEVDGRITEAAAITTNGARQRLSGIVGQQLSTASENGHTALNLESLGKYLAVKTIARDGTVIITALPCSGAQDTLLSVFMIICVVGISALGIAVTAGVIIIRRQFTPLAQVTAAAREVAELELERGEVNLPTPLVQVHPSQERTEFGLLGIAMNRLMERVADALSARYASESRARQFVADASHELRTPLAVIRGYIELAQRNRQQMPPTAAHAVARVESQAERMTGLVEDLLLLARLDSGRALVQEPVDLSSLVIEAVSDAHIAAPQHHWELDLPDQPIVAIGDSARLHQVVANLLANCRVHTPPGTQVKVALAETADWVHLSVTDNGPGIPEDQQTEIFERFARGDTSRSRKGGSTGLGLSIAAAVAKAHRGDIDVRSLPGETTFIAILPREIP